MRIRSQMRYYFSQPQNIILIVLSLLLILLTLFPLASLFKDSFVVHAQEINSIYNAQKQEAADRARNELNASGVTDKKTLDDAASAAKKAAQKPTVNSWTLYHWKKVFADSVNSMTIFYKPLKNSLIISIGSCLFALIIGGLFAWLITRTNLKYKQWISGLFMLPYIMPSWTIALSWRNFFRNSYAGGAIGLFTAITGVEVPNWFAYGPFPIIVTMGIHYAPFAYILIGGVLRNMDANLEEAAELMMASRGKILAKITFPITLPAILSTILLVFSSTFGSYAVPVFLGSATKFQVLTTQLSSKLSGSNPGYGYVMAIVMITFGIFILGMNQLITGTRKSYTTITGKSSNISMTRLRGRNVISVIAISFVIIMAIVPVVSFGLESLMYKSGDYSLKNLTLQFWAGEAQLNLANSEPGILRNADIWRSLWNSVKLSVLVSLVAGTTGILIGYATVKARGTRLASILNNLAFFPYLMPALAFSAIYLSMFSKPHWIVPSLYGSIWILLLAGSVKYLPFAARSGSNAMMQIGGSIEEAAVIMNIPWWKRMTRIIVPIQKSSFISGYLLPFISSMRELSLYVMLCTPTTKVVTTMLFAYNERGIEQYANAINLLIVIIVVAVNFIVNKATGASIDKGIGG